MVYKIKWGVIGSGGIAKRRTIPEGLMPAKNAELKFVYDIDRKANMDIAHTFNVKAAADIGELLSADIDAVYVAGPVTVHFEQVKMCANAGKHVLCEKPLGLTVAEAEEMLQVCRDNHVVLGTAFMMRYSSQHRQALEWIRSGRLGELVYGRAQLSCWYPPKAGAWRQDPSTGGGGSLIDLGSHCIDLLEMFFGPVDKVSCFIRNSVHAYKSEDSAVVILYFRNGGMATVDTFFCIPDNSSQNRLEIYGSKGSILASGTLGQSAAGDMRAYFEKQKTAYDARQIRSEEHCYTVSPPPVNTYCAEIEDFSSALLEKQHSHPSAFWGLASQKLLAACYLSAQSGTTVNFGDEI